MSQKRDPSTSSGQALWHPVRLAFAETDGVPAAVGGPAAVDGEAVAIDEGAFALVGEEGDGAGHVVGGGEASHGDAAGGGGGGGGAAGLVGCVHFGFDAAGADG